MIKSYYFLSQKTPSCMFDRFWIYLYLLSLATAVFKYTSNRNCRKQNLGISCGRCSFLNSNYSIPSRMFSCKFLDFSDWLIKRNFYENQIFYSHIQPNLNKNKGSCFYDVLLFLLILHLFKTQVKKCHLRYLIEFWMHLWWGLKMNSAIKLQ